VSSGYRAVARHVAGRHPVGVDEIYSAMMTAFDALGRRKVFSALLVRFPDISIPLEELIKVYRQHSPAINLFPGYAALLGELASHYRLGIITDGLPEIQERKVRALGLAGMVDKIVYSWDYGSEKGKPHPLSFSLMLESLQAEPPSAIFVGDNPDKDGRGAHGVGMTYAQIRHSRQRAMPAAEGMDPPEFVIDSILQLPQVLQQLSRNRN
jgi:putative hydrolase of the HAD superfamily